MSEKEKPFKFGEKLENKYASINNPIRIATFVKKVTRKGKINPGKFCVLTDKKGRFWEVDCEALRRASE